MYVAAGDRSYVSSDQCRSQSRSRILITLELERACHDADDCVSVNHLLMSGFILAQVQVLPSEPVVGVTLEAYTKCERGNKAQQIRCEDEAIGVTHVGDAIELVGLRHQWLRSIDYREAFCVVHPERPATVSCAFWRPDLAPYGYTFSDACHCSLDCFCLHFQLQRQQLEQAEQALRHSTEGMFEFKWNPAC